MSDGGLGGRGGGFLLGKPSLVPNTHFPPTSSALPAAAGQRLRVEDALSYLDQVKMQFQNRAQVYTDFLDIMKDFKSQAIDTPGVIQRVSTLFRGHPSLIVGFNTFLPLGYKIEVEGEHGERVSISTPSGQSHVITAGPPPGDAKLCPMIPGEAPPAPAPLDAAAVAAAQPPLEFNHAIAYVNKIKSRFAHKPHIYKQFLEILHSYQKEQRDLKTGLLSGSQKTQTESQVYGRVAILFAEDSDLLKEFSQFLPDAGSMPLGGSQPPLPPVSLPADPPPPKRSASSNGQPGTGAPPPKKSKALTPEPRKPTPRPNPIPISYDVPLSEAARHGTLEEFQFFEKVRKAFRSDVVYENFLRLLVLYNLELISNTELLELAHPFLGKFPELMRWLSEFLGCAEKQEPAEEAHISSDLALEIDYASCKRLGVSYRALPASYVQPKASGRTPLCDAVLNDTWVSFPSWSSEDTSNVTSKKSIYEEHIYKTEDERFELDIVMELNRAAIQSLEGLRRRLGAISEEEAKSRSSGIVSRPLIQRAVRRIYGDRATDILDGLERNPGVAVPLVLKRLKSKEEEWRDAQKAFNRLWREQNDKYYLKSLDQQSMTFKQNDLKALKSKALLNQIEVLYDERHEKQEETGQSISGPHLTFTYPSRRSIAYDVTDLLIHHVKRQPSIQKEDKCRIKRFLKQTLADLLGLRREDLSDDEEETEEAEGDEAEAGARPRRKVRGELGRGEAGGPVPSIARGEEAPRAGYSLVFVPNSYYVFFRLHHILSERLARLHDYATTLAVQSSKDAAKPPSAAALLKALPKQTVAPGEFYANLLGQVKNLLDGAVDNAQFEDTLREMFTTQAYHAFTMDKIIQTMVRQLSVMVSESSGTSTLGLWEQWRAEGGAGGPGFVSARRQEKEEAYQSAAEQCFRDQNCFKVFFKEETGELSLELVDTDADESDPSRDDWSSYLASYFASARTASPDGDDVESGEAALRRRLAEKPLLLYRRLRAARAAGAGSDVLARDGLEMVWRRGELRPRFVPFTGDALLRPNWRQRSRAYLTGPSASTRRRKWAQWLETKPTPDAASTSAWFLDGRQRLDSQPLPLLPSHSDFASLTVPLYRPS